MAILSKLFTSEIETDVEIDAPPETVWSVLHDFEAYPTWNPFIIEIVGDAAVGQTLTARIQPPGKKALTFKPTVTDVAINKNFEWLGRVGLPGLFDGRHRFELIALDGNTRTRLVHCEHFGGLLVPILAPLFNNNTKAGFVAMNDAIKLQAEAAVTRAGGSEAHRG